MISFALESPGFESHTDILSLLLCQFFYVVSIITARQRRQRTLLMKILIYDYIICDRSFSHTGQECLSMAVIDFSASACLSHPRIKLLSQTVHHCYMSRLMTKPTKWHVRPAKTQIRLGILPVWSESWLSAWRQLGSLASSYPLNAQRRLIKVGGCPDWSVS